MKKNLYALMAMLFVALLLPMNVSCGSDDDSGTSNEDLRTQAVGTWMCTKSTDISQGSSYNGLMVGKQVTIYANGTYTSTAPTFGYTGSYSVSGNTITAQSNQGATFVITVTIRGNNMTWEGTSSNGVTFTYVFVRESGNTSSPLNITKEMIVGDFYWQVMDFSVRRGSGNILSKDAKIRFYTDGTCEGFTSMENAYRINNGRIETYYKRTNEPMFVYTLLAQDGESVSVQMDGTLDDDLMAILTLKKVQVNEPNTQTSDEIWSTKEGLESARNACYRYLSEFEIAQQNLEKLRTSGKNGINAQNSYVTNAWNCAYQTISLANLILYYSASASNFGGTLSTKEIKEIVAELRGIRAFVYYNIAMLWGDVPLITEPNSGEYAIAHNEQTAVYYYASNEISAALSDLGEYNDVNERMHMRQDAGRMLKAEIEMTLGNHTLALSFLNQIDKQLYNNEKSMVWGVSNYNESTGTTTSIPVYNFDLLNLYSKEISSNKNETLAEWKNLSSTDYGYWAALKRMGQAQSVTGCADFELLMPFPYNYIEANPNAHQNKGY